MTRALRNPVKDERGAAMVEFALVFPLQLLFTLGVMQLALLYIGHLVTQYAAYQAARAAIITDCDSFKTERAAEIACEALAGGKKAGGLGGLRASATSVLKTNAKIIDRGENSGEVFVEVTHDFELIIPVVNKVFAFDYEHFFWFESRRLPSYQDATNRWLQAKYGATHMRITKTCAMVKPWKAKK